MVSGSTQEIPYPKFGAQQLKLLERLCNASGVSGDEREVRAIVLEQVAPYAQDVKVDPMGNVLVSCHSARSRSRSQPRLKVMLAAHMDEIGFMLTSDEGDGFFRFEKVGGIDERQLVGKPVLVGPNHIPGVIGAKPIHLTTADERKRTLSIDTLRIDIGPNGKAGVRIGQCATFATRFSRQGPSLLAKSLDDRLGVATLIELVKHAPPNIDLLAAFTVQEEVGLRGAKVAAHALDPDIAFVIDSTPALDLPNWDGDKNSASGNGRHNTFLDAGPAIYLADHGTLSDPHLIRHLVAVAEAKKIPYQFRQPGGGGTDAGAIHISRSGIRSVSVSIPGRYVHTALGIARLSDWQNTFYLIQAALENLTPDVLSAER
jgi:endoglucanase